MPKRSLVLRGAGIPARGT